MGKTKICERCGCQTDMLYPHKWENDFGEKRQKDICWDCDHDVINGGDIDEDIYDVCVQRGEEEYLFDPINNSPPWFYNRS